MRGTFERCAKARLSFSGGPHAPVNMAGSMRISVVELSGSKEAMEVPKNLKDSRKLGLRNIAQYSAAISCCFFPTDIHFFQFTGACGPPRFGAALVRSAHDCQTPLSAFQWSSSTTMSMLLTRWLSRATLQSSKALSRMQCYRMYGWSRGVKAIRLSLWEGAIPWCRLVTWWSPTLGMKTLERCLFVQLWISWLVKSGQAIQLNSL